MRKKSATPRPGASGTWCCGATIALAMALPACVRPLPDAALTLDPDMVTRATLHLDAPYAITAHATWGDEGSDPSTWLSSAEISGSNLDFNLYLHAGVSSSYQIVGVDDAGRAVQTPLAKVTTDDLPSGIPSFDSTIDVTLAGLGPYLLTSAISAVPGDTIVMIVTTDGRPVWYWQPGDGVVPAARYDAVTGQIYGTGFDERSGAYAYVFTLPIAGPGVKPTKTEVDWAHHDAVMLDDRADESSIGTIAVPVTVFQDVTVDGTTQSVAGDEVVEVAADGSQTTVWSAFDHLTPAVDDSWNISPFPSHQPDWTHANGLYYDPSEAAYYLSLWGPHQVVKIDRATGETVWNMGGPENEFDFGTDAGFGPQHAPDFSNGKLRIFDNRNATLGSRACEYTVNENARTATLDWSFSPDTTQWALVLGDVNVRDDGSHLLGWGSSGDIFSVDADNHLAGFLALSKALAIGQVTEIAVLP